MEDQSITDMIIFRQVTVTRKAEIERSQSDNPPAQFGAGVLHTKVRQEDGEWFFSAPFYFISFFKKYKINFINWWWS